MKALIGIDASGRNSPIELGHFFMAVKVEAFVELEVFKRQVGEISRQLRASRKAPRAERIYTPGEKEHEVWLYRKDRGVPFNDPLKASFREVKDKLGIEQALPF